jgi:excisionase family DNA binding protein
MEKLPKTLRIAQAAKLIGVSTMTLRRWEKAGVLTPLRIGPRKDRRYTKEQIQRLLKKNK